MEVRFWPADIQRLPESRTLLGDPSTLRPGVRVGPAHRQNDVVVIRCGKTEKSSGVDAYASIGAELRTYLDAFPKSLLYVVRDDGTSIDANTLAKRMRKQLNGLGVRGYTVHGLRHQRGMELAEAGCSKFEIMKLYRGSLVRAFSTTRES